MQVLLSTMNIKSDNELNNLLNKMNITTNYLVINQVASKKETNIKNMNAITVENKGLSKSRNLALKNSKDDILILADDDVIYEKEYNQIIEDAYKKYSKADIICFFVESKNKSRKIKRIRTGKIGFLRIMQISSFQISMRKSSIKNIRFDENFGAGSIYDRGEETIFLRDCLKKGLEIRFVNKKIASVEQRQSTWFKGFTEDYLYKQGKVFKRIYPRFYLIIDIQFAIRKHKLYKNNVSFFKALKLMLNT